MQPPLWMFLFFCWRVQCNVSKIYNEGFHLHIKKCIKVIQWKYTGLHGHYQIVPQQYTFIQCNETHSTSMSTCLKEAFLDSTTFYFKRICVICILQPLQSLYVYSLKRVPWHNQVNTSIQWAYTLVHWECRIYTKQTHVKHCTPTSTREKRHPQQYT